MKFDDFSVMGKDQEILLKFSKRIKELRLAKGVTQQDAYNDTGIHFGRIEQGKRDVSLTTLVKIAEYFEVEVGDIL
ncbi:MAG: helix-turn-helix domain-containing protein [Putridiphycobacter sp.]